MRRSNRVGFDLRRNPSRVEPLEPRLLLATITGNIYEDLNENGVRDAGDRSHIDGVAWVDLNRDGRFGGGEPYHVASSQTGDYVISGVPVGTHDLRVLRISGQRVTEPSEDGVYVVTITSVDQTIGGFNFGLADSEVGTIKGVVLHDLDADAQRDTTDAPLTGWTVFVDKANFGVLDPDERRATTAADGSYRLDGLPRSTPHRLTVLVPDGWRTYQSQAPSASLPAPLPVQTFTLSGGEIKVADFLSVPVVPSPLLDLSFGVGGVLRAVDPSAWDPDGAGAVRGVLDAQGNGFFVLVEGGLFKLRDDGSQDRTFGSNGRVGLDAPWERLAVDSRGRPVIARVVETGAELRRYNTDGTADATFGTGGAWTFGSLRGFTMTELIVRPDDRAVIGGNHGGWMATAQMSATGGADVSYGFGGGVARFGFDTTTAIAHAPANKLVIAGKRGDINTVYRRDTTGRSDNTFSGDGALPLSSSFPITDVGTIHDVLVQSDGKILLAVTRAEPGFHVIRLTSAGALDTSYGGGDGVATVTFARGPAAAARQLLLQPDGRLLVAGTAEVTMRDQSELAVVRLLPDGTLDEAFADAGRLVAPQTWYEESFVDAFLGADGYIVAALDPLNPAFHDVIVRLAPRPPALSVTGVVFNDLDEDGVREAGEPGVAGVTLFTDHDGDGARDHGEPITITNDRGGYALEVVPGTPQRVTALRPNAGWSFVAPVTGTRTVSLPAGGEHARGIDFAFGDVLAPRLIDIDVRPPTNPNASPVWALRFDEAIARSGLVPGAFRLRNAAAQDVPITPGQITYEPETNTVLVSPSLQTGAYRFSVLSGVGGGTLTDLSGNPLPGGVADHGLFLLRDGIWTLRRTPAGEIEVVGTSVRMPAGDVDEMIFAGTGSSDQLRLDLGGGNPLPAGAEIWFDGGTGGADQLVVDGAPAAANDVTFSDTDITIDGVRAETGRFLRRTFDGRGGGEDVLSVAKTSVDLQGGNKRFASLAITGNGHVAAYRPTASAADVLAVGDLTMSDDARLVLYTAGLVLHATPDTRAAVLASAIARIKSDPVTGNGIAMPQSPATPNTHVAATINPGLDTFGGYAVDDNAILVTRTYTGDANLDGVVNADDYFRIDSGFLAQPAAPTYAQGDFNYDGKINSDDYFLIDSAFLGQGTPLAAAGATDTVTTRAVAGPADVGRKAKRGTTVRPPRVY